MNVTASYVNLMCAALKSSSYTNDTASVSARITSIRHNRFIVVRDYTNFSIQLHVCEGYSPRKCVLLAKLLRAGDLVNAFGAIYKDKRGNASILVRALELCSKCDRSKWVKYGISQQRLRAVVRKTRVAQEIRRQLLRLGYTEVETPVLQSPEPSSVNPFVTRYDWRKQLLQLRVSPEFCLKSCMCAGECKGIFEFAKSFRNEGESAFHLREFNLLELYCVDLSWNACLNWLKSLLMRLCIVFNTPQPNQRVLSYCELIRERTGYRLELTDADNVLNLVRALGLEVKRLRWAELVSVLFESLVSSTRELLYVLWYPVDCSPFAQAKWSGSRFALRLEVYWDGVELVNACIELSCFAEQLKRCGAQISATLSESLAHGLGYVFGLGIGVDRLSALLFSNPQLTRW
ncbi:MAG: amino acid--tRNA ligase-related protein [Candidatus Hodgkinia cicadicola]